ncbi:hypothetical protein [Streptomyces sp. RTd22]|uniref:hypothetical protein n=1 Tax=Streptomyces sp. RTd22 TaxID=1841249 RepID=UPI0007C5CE2D|nr:hypothetical protein [Streptomyces sp. RTd22]
MSLVAEVGDMGEVPVLRAADFSRRAPFVRTDEDVPHEGALADLYGLEADEAIERAIEQGVLRWSVNLRTGETVLLRPFKYSNI